MSLASSVVPTYPIPSPNASPAVTFGDLYLLLLRPDRSGPEHLQQVLAAAVRYEPQFPATASALEQTLTRILGQPVRLRAPQLHAFKRLADRPVLAELSPWNLPPQYGELPEMVPASSLNDIYLALLKPDGGMIKRFKAVQAAAALYEPGVPGSQEALEQELSQLIGRRVQLSAPQLRCFKELLIDEPAFAHIAPWE
ncbi:hypothetical protein, partial [Hyalangium sp.]|uniref:hypothetical protein n=1 Tax=Hyalangium sp. TaxID=2028555 RepID=UPI002D29C4D8